MTPAKLRLARAAMGQPETKVRDLCAELGITRQALYRFVGPNGELRADGEKLLAVASAKPEAFRGDRLAAFSAALDALRSFSCEGSMTQSDPAKTLRAYAKHRRAQALTPLSQGHEIV